MKTDVPYQNRKLFGLMNCPKNKHTLISKLIHEQYNKSIYITHGSMSVYSYMYALYIIPHYQVFIVYINPITTFIVHIIMSYSMFYSLMISCFIVLGHK